MSINNEQQRIQAVSATEAQRLERYIAAACDAQPLLSAPPGLHARVMAVIEQRAREWWRAPLRNWPSWAQAALVLLCLLSTWLLVADNTPLAANGNSIEQWVFMPWALADIFASLLAVSRELLWLVLRISPVLWLCALVVSGVALTIGVLGLSRLTTRHA